jgi:lipopolysaccharide export system protein LptA
MNPILGLALTGALVIVLLSTNTPRPAAGAGSARGIVREIALIQPQPEPVASAPPNRGESPQPQPGSPQPQPAGSLLPVPPAPSGEPVPSPLEASPAPSLPPGAAPAGPSPAPSPIASGRFHLHRPGTDVDGDALNGSMASQAYVLKGNVTLHSDPKIDREIAAASESDDPLTLTADEIDADRSGFTYVAKGHVHFVQGTRSGFADLAMLDERNHTLDLIGNVEVLEGNHRTKAAKMHYDTLTKDFIGSGNVRIYEPLPTPNPNVSATPPPKHKRRLPL